MRIMQQFARKICLIRLFVLATGFLFSPLVYSAGPTTLSYQGVLTDSGGTKVDGSYTITFSIYDVISGGTALWSETQPVPVNSGLFTVELGAVTTFPSHLFDQPLWLGIDVNGDGEMSPRTALTAAGFSFETDSIDNRIAKNNGTISHGSTIPLPQYADGTQATSNQCVYTVSPQTFDSATAGWNTSQNYSVNGSRVVTAQSRLADGSVVYRTANYLIICTR